MTLYNVRNTTIVSIIVPESGLDQFKVKKHCCLISYAPALQGVSTRGGRLPSSLSCAQLGEKGVAVYVGLYDM